MQTFDTLVVSSFATLLETSYQQASGHLPQSESDVTVSVKPYTGIDDMTNVFNAVSDAAIHSTDSVTWLASQLLSAGRSDIAAPHARRGPAAAARKNPEDRTSYVTDCGTASLREGWGSD